VSDSVVYGIRNNWKQFSLLVLINAFVGGMVGMERSVFPTLAASDFGITSTSAILSFIISFGISKAIANYFTGRYANKFGRKNLLLAGWLLAIPIPFIIIYADNWNWIVFANVLLGIHQGLAWSSTVLMKIDIAGSKNRGLAMGINEFAGYLSVGIVAFATGYIAETYGVRPYPFYIGIFLAITGFFATLLFVKDTRAFVEAEIPSSHLDSQKNIFLETTFKNKNLSAVTQAGLINNLNDGMIWGLLPILLLSLHFNQQEIGVIAFVYPAVWGLGQLITGKISDIVSKRNLLFAGMITQGIAILFLPYAISYSQFILISVFLGVGTAMVYPTFLNAIATFTQPQQRAESIGVFRLWRDLGYAFGAIITGIFADYFNISVAILITGCLTLASGFIVLFRMKMLASDFKPECIKQQVVKIYLQQKQFEVTIIDVDDEREYLQHHIPQAINIPIGNLTHNSSLINKNQIIVFTSRKGEELSKKASLLFRNLGFSKSFWLCGGTHDWVPTP